MIHVKEGISCLQRMAGSSAVRWVANKNWVLRNKCFAFKASTEFLREKVNSPSFMEERNVELPSYSVFHDLGLSAVGREDGPDAPPLVLSSFYDSLIHMLENSF